MKDEDFIQALVGAFSTLYAISMANSVLLLRAGISTQVYEDAIRANMKNAALYRSQIHASLLGEKPPARTEKEIWEDLNLGDLWRKSTEQDEGGAILPPQQ